MIYFLSSAHGSIHFRTGTYFKIYPFPPYSIPVLTLQVILGVVIHVVFNQKVIGYMYQYLYI